MKRKHNNKSTFFVVLAIVVVAIVLLGFDTFKSLITRAGSARASTREVALSCTTDMATQFHIHPNLQIVINGTREEIPANIGITLSCMHPLHTHDATGKIHVESPQQRDFTLADFFAVWGKQFSKDQILDSRADASHEIVMTVDGEPSQEYENLVLKDNQQILIVYRTK